MAGSPSNLITPLKVGLLVSGAFVSFVVFLQIVSTRGFSTGETYPVSALFEDVLGLEPASPVQIAGIDVGQIREVYLDGGRARVVLDIRSDVELYQDAKIEKVAISLLGDYKLAVDPGSASMPRIAPGEEITHVSSQSDIDAITAEVRTISEALSRLIAGRDGEASILQTIVYDVQGTVAAARSITESVRKDIDANTRRLESILKNMDEFTTDLRSLSQGRDQDVDAIVADTRKIAESIRRTSESVERMIAGSREEELEASIESLRASMEALNRGLENVASITEKINHGEGTVGKLINDNELYNNANEAVEGVNALVGGITRLQTWVNLRSEFQFRTSSAKNYVQLVLQPSEDKSYIFELVNDPRGVRNVVIEDIERTSPEQGQAFRERVRTTRVTEGFNFSLMFAKRLYFLQLRFGIIEGSGGIGANFFFLSDRLRLLFDLNRLGEDDRMPRVKALAEMQLIPHIYMHGGVDDVLNTGTSDFFLGLGIRFNDEDLKTILALVGGGALTGSN
ncbi:MAG: MCE family protein [Myxococcales bacterium]|nr:MCE family protein [Myxococcales bacterium]